MSLPNKSEFQCIDHGKFKVTGDITFSSAASVWEQARKVLLSLEEDRLDIDIGSAREMDSGGLALLIAWTRWAYCNKKELTFSNASDTARKLIVTNKLQDLLKLA
ncbi:MAG: STAS domain-containing protein [Gammaproteobacteria bacterium]|nr:STAS domain-containing protein [Gammaproteobacteria bacterium]